MENIDQFLRAAREFGVQDVDIFQTVDLFERHNIPAVTRCLMAVKRIADAKFGPDAKFKVRTRKIMHLLIDIPSSLNLNVFLSNIK